MSVRTPVGLLDVAVEVLVADPAASLGEVAAAAGIGRTTLHKHYPTRDDLLRAVADRSIEAWERAVESAERQESPDGGLRALAEALVSIGRHLAFLWRTPVFDHMADIGLRCRALDARSLAVLSRARSQGAVRADVPDYWLIQTFHSLVYVAAESVDSGHLAPRDAPGLAVDTFLRGLS
jgi:AcrR family transcriptional regulator